MKAETPNLGKGYFTRGLFMLSTVLLIALSFAFDAFQQGFSMPIYFTLFAILLAEVILMVYNKHHRIWNFTKWAIIGGITVLALIG